MAVQGIAAAGISMLGLTEPLQPRALSDFTHRLRSQHGHKYRTTGYRALKETIRHIKQGGIVAILLDRDVGGTGAPMQLCGAETRIPLGGISLALRTDSYLIPAWAWRIPGYRFRIRIGPPLEPVRSGNFDEDVRTNAQRLLDLFEEHLRSDPGQWAVLEEIWHTADREPAVTSGAVQ